MSHDHSQDERYAAEAEIINALMPFLPGAPASRTERERPPCTHCGREDDSYNGGGSIEITLDGKKLAFCGAGHMADYLEAHPEASFKQAPHIEVYPVEDRPYWMHNGCNHCRSEAESNHYIILEGAPFNSCFDDERDEAFCCRECLLARLRENEQKMQGLLPWYMYPEPPE